MLADYKDVKPNVNVMRDVIVRREYYYEKAEIVAAHLCIFAFRIG